MTIEIANRVRMIHIPRTAGCSVEEWALLHFNTNVLVSNDVVGRHCHESAKEALESGNMDFTFSTVRNPYDRLVSLFMQRRKGFPNYTKSFSEWILDLKQGKRHLVLNRFLRFGFAQKPFLNAPIDLVIRFENLNKDFEIIQDYLKVYAPLHHVNKTLRDRDYRSYYTSETKKIVTKLVEEDLDSFKYTF
jgi:hypothetical protein